MSTGNLPAVLSRANLKRDNLTSETGRKFPSGRDPLSNLSND